MAGTTLVLKEENLVVLENVEKSVYEELQHKAGEENCTCCERISCSPWQGILCTLE